MEECGAAVDYFFCRWRKAWRKEGEEVSWWCHIKVEGGCSFVHEKELTVETHERKL